MVRGDTVALVGEVDEDMDSTMEKTARKGQPLGEMFPGRVGM